MSERFNTWLQNTFLLADRTPPAEGAPKPTHCSGNRASCFEHLLDFLDGRMSEENEIKMQANIEACKACYDEFDVQLAIRAALQHKVKEEAVPSKLIEEIRGKITELA